MQTAELGTLDNFKCPNWTHYCLCDQPNKSAMCSDVNVHD